MSEAYNIPLLVVEFVNVEQGGSFTEHNAIIANIPNIILNLYTINSSGLSQREEGLNFILLFIENLEKDIVNLFLFKKFIEDKKRFYYNIILFLYNN